MSLPFHDLSSFLAWMFSNTLWWFVQLIFGALVISLASGLASRFGLHKDWRSSGWIVASVFVISVVVLVLLRPAQPTADLQPYIMSTAFGGITNGEENNKTIIFASVRNAGRLPSSVTDVKVAVVINGKTFQGRLYDMPAHITLSKKGGGSVDYAKSESLYMKISHKIDGGDAIAGLLIVSFPGVTNNDMQYGDTLIRLTIKDIYSRTTSTESKLAESTDHDMKVFPGINADSH